MIYIKDKQSSHVSNIISSLSNDVCIYNICSVQLNSFTSLYICEYMDLDQ